MIEGGCQCGAVRYQLMRDRVAVYACHCRECQKQSASAFALSAPVRATDLVLSGAVRTYERPAASGAVTRCHFCLECGVRLHHVSDRSPEVVTIKAGTLDETGHLHPVAHLWTRSKQPWVALDPAIPAFDTQPADFPAWRSTLLEL